MFFAIAAPLLAEGPDLSGASGWAGAGMLGMVLFWLLYKHIPVLTTGYLNQIKDLSDTFERSLDRVVKHCEDETNNLASTWKVEVDRLVTGIRSAKREESDRLSTTLEAVRSRDAADLKATLTEIMHPTKKPGTGQAKA